MLYPLNSHAYSLLSPSLVIAVLQVVHVFAYSR